MPIVTQAQTATQTQTAPQPAAVVQPAAAAQPIAVVQPTAQLTKILVATDYAAYGQFDYKIKWVLTSRLQVNAVVLQKIEVSYCVKDQHDNLINISTYTNNWCSWHTHGTYWEAWFIRANELRPTYSAANPRVPSFDALATIDDEWDDNYQTGTIYDKRSNPNSDVKGITKGWVRYIGKAALYRVDDLNRWNQNWESLFQAYNANQPTPAGTLLYTANNPNFPALAMEGREESHNMVAYWNSCWPSYCHTKLTKIEPNQTYTDSVLWTKVIARGPAQAPQLTQALAGTKRKTPTANCATPSLATSSSSASSSSSSWSVSNSAANAPRFSITFKKQKVASQTP